MATVKVSQLTEKTVLADADLFPIVDAGQSSSKKVKYSTIKNDIRPYKVYVALLTQAGTDAPVATVLENTLGGTVVWTRSDAGVYIGTLASAFTENKTFVTPPYFYSPANWRDINVIFYRNDINSVKIESGLSASTTPCDDVLSVFPIEIRVYN
jgi:hypothetical protein